MAQKTKYMKSIFNYSLLLIIVVGAILGEIYVERSKNNRYSTTVDSFIVSSSMFVSAVEMKLEAVKSYKKYLATDSVIYKNNCDSLESASVALQEQSSIFLPYQYRKHDTDK